MIYKGMVCQWCGATTNSSLLTHFRRNGIFPNACSASQRWTWIFYTSSWGYLYPKGTDISNYLQLSPTISNESAVSKDGRHHRYPSRAHQSKLLGIARSTSYYKCKEDESQRNLKMIDLMDKQYNRCATMGVRQMVDYLKGEGIMSGRNLRGA